MNPTGEPHFVRKAAAFLDLTDEERAWVDAYHAEVERTLSPRLPDDVAAWLKGRCAPL